MRAEGWRDAANPARPSCHGLTCKAVFSATSSHGRPDGRPAIWARFSLWNT